MLGVIDRTCLCTEELVGTHVIAGILGRTAAFEVRQLDLTMRVFIHVILRLF